MSDLIERQAALSIIRMAMPEETSGSLLYQSVKQIPTIDAVPVVRCGDCKWWNGYYRECESPNWNTGTDKYIVQPAGMFCGWGERKSEDPSHPCADSVMMGD